MTYDPNAKRSMDYAVAGISLGGGPGPGYWVERDGRRIFESTNWRDVAMFAEELFERLLIARRMVE